MKKLSNRGFSLVEVLVALGVAGGVALLVAELYKNSVSQTSNIESRYARIDLEQSVRMSLMSPESCKCNFKDVVINPATPTDIPLTELRTYFQGSNCDITKSKLMFEAGKVVPLQTQLKLETIAVMRLIFPSPKQAAGDLVFTYNANEKQKFRPSVLTNLQFKLADQPDGTKKVESCGFATVGSKTCGPGKFCFNGKELEFRNDVGNLISATLQFENETGFTLSFHTAAGRNTVLNFTETAGTLVATSPPGWRPQFCFSHLAPHCGTSNFFGLTQFNCDSAIHWSGDYTGNTTATKVSCP